MGRGRQKAKNTKVARELKYFSPNTDLEALQREIGSGESESDQYEDKWADMYADEDETEERDAQLLRGVLVVVPARGALLTVGVVVFVLLAEEAGDLHGGE